MESSIVSGILAQCLVEMPKITTAELYEKCNGMIGTTTLPNFRIALSKWLTDKDDPNHIPGYEARLGRTGGIYPKNRPNVSLTSSVDVEQLDPVKVKATITTALETAPRITAGELFLLLKLENTTEAQFRLQLKKLFNDGALSEFETRKGLTGGIYPTDGETVKWTPESSDEDSEESSSFSLQITPSLRVVQSDERNWTIQKLSGNTWTNKGYHPDIAGCLRSVVKHAINGEFKLSHSVVELNNLASVFAEMEGRIFSQLEKAVVAQA